MLTINHDHSAGEIVIHTPQGMILINECQTPNMTRIVILPTQSGYLSMSDGQPAIMTIWAGVQIVEPDRDEEATEEIRPLFDEVE